MLLFVYLEQICLNVDMEIKNGDIIWPVVIVLGFRTTHFPCSKTEKSDLNGIFLMNMV